MTTPEATMDAGDVERVARNKRVQTRYDEFMRAGRHGHYETLFRIVREEVEHFFTPDLYRAGLERAKEIVEQDLASCGKLEAQCAPETEGAKRWNLVTLILRDLAAKFAAELASLPPSDAVREDGWQPIATAPKDGTPILACDAAVLGATYIVDWEEPGWRTSESDGNHMGFNAHAFTHWMSLPPAPGPS